MPRIAVLLRDWSSRRYDAVQAIYKFASLQSKWTVGVFENIREIEQFPLLAAWKPDGVVTCPEGASAEQIQAIRALNVPVVNIGSVIDRISSVVVDPQSVIDLTWDCLASLQPRTLILAGSQNHRALARTSKRWADE